MMLGARYFPEGRTRCLKERGGVLGWPEGRTAAGSGGTLCGAVPSWERTASAGTFLSETQRKVQIRWGSNHFLSEEVIPFYANTSVNKFAYGVKLSLQET